MASWCFAKVLIGSDFRELNVPCNEYSAGIYARPRHIEKMPIGI